MTVEENPDLYVCALLSQMVTARDGDVRREFQEAVTTLNRLRGYSPEEVLRLIEQALVLNGDLEFDSLVGLCKQQLDDNQIREALGLLAYLARLEGVSDQEEETFAMLCLGLGVTINRGRVEIAR